jgi:very-short-patch-repair endonuclease
MTVPESSLADDEPAISEDFLQGDIARGLEVKTDPFAREYVARYEDSLEPFFIKNLENVQGEERDVMYISVTYGRNAAGHVYQRFGPINSLTGHRRLNVLFTRARRRTVVFASMSSGDLVAEPRSAWGLRALKGYLQFAETGILEQALFSGREPDSDFEIEVADSLRARGFEVVAQVGVAGYFVDLAIKHPRRADAFLLGIECDGATYHSAKSARDRDRLREKVLNGLGWKLHRVWSTDWFKQPKEETDRIVRRIEALLRSEPVEPPRPKHAPAPVESLRATATAAAAALNGPLTEAEARDQLIVLRAQGGNEPLPSGLASLFLDEMIEALLRAKPRDRDEYSRGIPVGLRIRTATAEITKYLDSVIAITGRITR